MGLVQQQDLQDYCSLDPIVSTPFFHQWWQEIDSLCCWPSYIVVTITIMCQGDRKDMILCTSWGKYMTPSEICFLIIIIQQRTLLWMKVLCHGGAIYTSECTNQTSLVSSHISFVMIGVTAASMNFTLAVSLVPLMIYVCSWWTDTRTATIIYMYNFFLYISHSVFSSLWAGYWCMWHSSS